MTPISLLALAAGAAALLLVITAAPAHADWRLRQRARRRLGVHAAPALPGSVRRAMAAPILRRASAGWAAALPTRLIQRFEASGKKVAPAHFAAGCVGLTLLAVTALILAGAGLALALLLGIAVGLGIPWAVLGQLAARRRSEFARAFPDALGLIVRGLKAGLPVADTLVEAGREISGPAGAEFRGVADQLRLGQALEAVLWAMARRLALPGFDFFVITLSVQRETGGNLAETLANLDEMLRARYAMRLKVRAMASEAVASAAIIGALPLVMAAIMYFVSPGYLEPLLATTAGHVLLAAAGLSMGIGALVMRAMVRFEL